MKLRTIPYLQFLFGNLLLLIILAIPPQYLAAQSYQQDTATINRLLMSAKSKRFKDTTAAINDAKAGLSLALKINDGYWIYTAYRRMARIHEANNNFAKAHNYFLQALSVVGVVNDSTKSLIYSEVATSFHHIGKMHEAHDYFLKNYALGQKTQNTFILQTACLGLGIFYNDLNQFEKASEFLIKNAELSEKLNNVEEVCDGYRILASLYLKTKNYKLAASNIEKAISYVNQIDENVFPRYYLLLSYSGILKEIGKYDDAIMQANDALERAQKINDKTVKIKAYILLADCYNKKNDFMLAEHYYDEAMVDVATMSNFDRIAYYYSYGKLLLKKKQYNNAIVFLQKSIENSEKEQSNFWLQNNYTQLAEAYEKIGRIDSSLFCLKKSNVLKDSLYKEENTKRLVEAQFKYDLGKSETQIEQMRNRQFSTLVAGIIAFFVLLTLFLIYFLRSNRERNKMLLEKAAAIKDKNRQLEDANEILRQFAYASAHDLKEPLRSINSFVNIIQKKYVKDLPIEATEYMGFVTKGVKRMESLLNALLEFSSVLTKDNIADKQNAVIPILNDVFYAYQNLIVQKNAVIRYPSVFPKVFMSEAYLKQLLMNLISNALKFSKEEAKIEIGYDNKMEEVIIFIKDEGIGFDKSYGDKIFKLFQRLDASTQREGVGVGLSICKNIVDKFNGRIWFESVPNQGTTFYIAFPKTMISEMPLGKPTPQPACPVGRYFEVKKQKQTEYSESV